MTAYYLTPSQQSQHPLAGLVFKSTSQPSLYMTPQPQKTNTNVPIHIQMKEALKAVNPSDHIIQRRQQQLVQDDTSNYDGHGRKAFPNGDFYEGHFRKGKMEGHGMMVSSRGDVYQGMFKNGFKHGKGKILYQDGSWYDGDWIYNKIEGKGNMVDANGNSYEGDFKDNLKNGIGKCRYAQSGMRFDGFWSNNIPEKGELYLSNGTNYEGEWRDDKFSGVGTIRFVNGDIYEGEWKEHVPHRYGKMLYRNGRIYNGEWAMSKKHGQGTMNFPNGDLYEGEWRDDFRDGFGIQRYSKGDVFEGEWLMDKMNGKGILMHSDGSVYEGIWEHGQKMEGNGVFKYSNGNVAVRSNYSINDRHQHLLFTNSVAAHRFNMIGNGAQTNGQAMTQGHSQANLPQNTMSSVHPTFVMRPRPLPLPVSALQQIQRPDILNGPKIIQQAPQQNFMQQSIPLISSMPESQLSNYSAADHTPILLQQSQQQQQQPILQPSQNSTPASDKNRAKTERAATSLSQNAKNNIIGSGASTKPKEAAPSPTSKGGESFKGLQLKPTGKK